MRVEWLPMARVAPLVRRPVEIYPDALYPEIGIRSFGRGTFHKPDLNGAAVGTKRLFEIHSGDLLFNIVFAWEGAVAVARPSDHGRFGSHRFLTCVCNPEIAEPRYLAFYFTTPGGRAQLLQASPGGAGRNRTLGLAALEEIRVPLPRIEEQRRLVAQIDRITALGVEARALQSEVDEELYHMIVATHLAAAQAPMEMAEFLVLEEDQAPIYVGTDYPQVGIRAYGAGMFVKPQVTGSQTTYRSFNRLHKNMLVLSQVKGWEGAVAVCDKELAGRFVSPEYRTFTCRSGRLHPGYLRALVSTPWFHAKLAELTRGQGARRERVRPELFLSMKLGMPRYHEQQRASSIFARVSDIRAIHAEQRAEFDQLLPSLLRKTFASALQSTHWLGERPAA